MPTHAHSSVEIRHLLPCRGHRCCLLGLVVVAHLAWISVLPGRAVRAQAVEASSSRSGGGAPLLVARREASANLAVDTRQPKPPYCNEQVQEAEQRFARAEDALNDFVAREIERRRDALFALRVRQAEEEHRTRTLQRSGAAAGLTGKTAVGAARSARVTEAFLGENTTGNRNPAYIIIERALVKARGERQELLARLGQRHAAVSRADDELGQLKKLLHQTAQVAADKGDLEIDNQKTVAKTENAAVNPADFGAVALPPERLDMERELARIEKSDAYQVLHERLVDARKVLTAVTARTAQASEPRVLVTATSAAGESNPFKFWHVVVLGSLVSLVGFVVPAVRKHVIPTAVLASVDDIQRSFGLPITGYISIESAPETVFAHKSD